jgi:hypothetical protein
MSVSATSHTLYHSQLMSLYFCFVLQFNIWHRIGVSSLVSYDYVICLIGHSVGIFISLCWDLLITPLVTSDYAFGIFWLPFWYHLITSLVPLDTLLVSSDHSIGIFRSLIWYLLILLPIWYLLIAPSIFPDCSSASCNFLFCIFWSPFG